jgi:hypothetical protein
MGQDNEALEQRSGLLPITVNRAEQAAESTFCYGAAMKGFDRFFGTHVATAMIFTIDVSRPRVKGKSLLPIRPEWRLRI